MKTPPLRAIPLSRPLARQIWLVIALEVSTGTATCAVKFVHVHQMRDVAATAGDQHPASLSRYRLTIADGFGYEFGGKDVHGSIDFYKFTFNQFVGNIFFQDLAVNFCGLHANTMPF